LSAAALVIVIGIAMLAWLPRWSDRVIPELHDVIFSVQRWHLLVVLTGVWVLRRFLLAIADPTPQRVRMAVSQGILSIVMFDAAACYAVRGVFCAAMILLLLVPAMLLGRWIETT
jgi:hypothetical protein